ncbi:MAG: DUF1573 domain-containing protein [Muribaculaceae bacterium]|nr:DUF1573 domain-containing protein [Muribaculaceae bacterium]
MKNSIYTVILVILIAFGMTAYAEAASKKDARMEFKESVYDFGDVSVARGKVSHEFTFVNTGGKNLTIKGATADCGCTKPEYSDEPVGPGKSGKVKVTFVPNGRGHFSKKVTLRTNGNPGKVRLVIKGTMVP